MSGQDDTRDDGTKVSRFGDLRQVSRIAAPVREQVVTMLRNAILSAELLPGERLVEREICEATGASRTSVREALRQLEGEGLITIRPQRGPIVSVIGVDEVRSLYETRSVLEALVARSCAERASAAEIVDILDATAHAGKAASGDDVAAVAAANAAVYDCLISASRNPVAGHVLRLLHGRISLLRSMTLSAPNIAQQLADEMRAVAQAIERRDADAAGRLASERVIKAGALAVQLLGERGAGASADADSAAARPA